MHNLIKAFLSLSILSISGVAFSQTLVQKANELIESSQFSEAKKLILSTSLDNPEYRNLQKVLLSIQEAQDEFVQKNIDEANLYYLNRDTDYGRAILVVTEALKVLPKDTRLLETYSFIDDIRKQEVQKYKQEILTNHARYLLDVVKLEYAVKDLSPDDQIVQARYEQFLLEMQQVANQLALQAEELFKVDIQLAAAHNSALLAYQLNPNEEITRIYTKIDQRMKTRVADIEQLESLQQRERNEVEINYWTDQFTVDITSDNITDANRAIIELESFGVDTQELKARVDRKIEQLVQRALDRGNTLWSEGRIEDALAKWLEVQQYGRENRVLNNNIAKAQSFIAYYNEVKKSK